MKKLDVGTVNILIANILGWQRISDDDGIDFVNAWKLPNSIISQGLPNWTISLSIHEGTTIEKLRKEVKGIHIEFEFSNWIDPEHNDGNIIYCLLMYPVKNDPNCWETKYQGEGKTMAEALSQAFLEYGEEILK